MASRAWTYAYAHVDCRQDRQSTKLLVSQVLRNCIPVTKGIFDNFDWWLKGWIPSKSRRGISPLFAETRLFQANHEVVSHSKHKQLEHPTQWTCEARAWVCRYHWGIFLHWFRPRRGNICVWICRYIPPPRKEQHIQGGRSRQYSVEDICSTSIYKGELPKNSEFVWTVLCSEPDLRKRNHGNNSDILEINAQDRTCRSSSDLPDLSDEALLR